MDYQNLKTFIEDNDLGSAKLDAALAPFTWFKVGGAAKLLFKPKDKASLIRFLQEKPQGLDILLIGAASNMIIRDGGFNGCAIRLGRGFSSIEILDDHFIKAGAFALDVNIARFAAENGLTGLEFMIGIPGTVGGGLFMNAGAYGGEFKDVLHEIHAVTYSGEKRILSPADLNMSYRHTSPPEPLIFTAAIFKTSGNDKPGSIKQRLEEIKTKREESQPVKEKTGGSTFANPTSEDCLNAGLKEQMKAWQLIQGAGCDQLQIGDAKMSEKHKNFMINLGQATANDLESLGEEIIKRVKKQYGVTLRWEIRRIGEKK